LATGHSIWLAVLATQAALMETGFEATTVGAVVGLGTAVGALVGAAGGLVGAAGFAVAAVAAVAAAGGVVGATGGVVGAEAGAGAGAHAEANATPPNSSVPRKSARRDVPIQQPSLIGLNILPMVGVSRLRCARGDTM
jgi:hypothetical protein